MQINDQIISLISKKLSRQASAEELDQLQHWIASGAGNREAYAEFAQIWEESKAALDVHPFDAAAAWLKIDPQLNYREHTGLQPSLRRIFKQVAVAASLVLAAGTGYYLFTRPPSLQAVAAAENRTLKLPDGSLVTMRKGSAVQYSRQFSERLVRLQGEAFFQVVHNRGTFHVLAGKASVTVTGTSFFVRSSDSADEVTVASGTVHVADAKKEETAVVLGAGQKAVLQQNHLQRSLVTDSNYMAWKTGVLDFHNASMAKVLSDLGYYYAVPMEAASRHAASIGGISITVRFSNQPLEQVLDELKLITGLSVRRESNKIIFDEK